jgi:hypothetical protein
VQRLTNPKDARRVELSLTPTGRRLVERAPNAAQDRLLQAVQLLPPEQRSELAQLLNQVVSQLEAPERPGKAAPSMFFEEASGRNRKKKALSLPVSKEARHA